MFLGILVLLFIERFSSCSSNKNESAKKQKDKGSNIINRTKARSPNSLELVKNIQSLANVERGCILI